MGINFAINSLLPEILLSQALLIVPKLKKELLLVRSDNVGGRPDACDEFCMNAGMTRGGRMDAQPVVIWRCTLA
jgi:hypothetical protein